MISYVILLLISVRLYHHTNTLKGDFLWLCSLLYLLEDVCYNAYPEIVALQFLFPDIIFGFIPLKH